MSHLFIWSQLVLISSLLLKLSGNIYPALALLLTAFLYQIIDWFLLSKLKIRFHPSLIPLLFRPACFWSSMRHIHPFYSVFFFSLLFFSMGLFFYYSLPFLPLIHPIFWTALVFASGISSFYLPKMDPFLTNPLYLLELEGWKKTFKTANPSSFSPQFPNEECHFLSPEFPLFRLTRQFRRTKLFEIRIEKNEKPHLIFLILESFRAKNVGCLGAQKPLSPCFDELAKKGILFSRFHAAGNLTNRSAIASLFGIPAAPRPWHMGRYVDIPLFGLPQILELQGYHPALIQGGPVSFDHGVEFFQKNGFRTLLGKRDIEQERHCSGTSWGVYDEHLIPFAASWLAKQNDPTFLTLFTITNHHPWISPPNWTPPSPAQESPYLSTFSYTDWALGLFIDELRKKKLLEKSILFIFGDHGQELADRDPHFEVNRHLYQETIHVPLLIYGEARIDRPVQIDTVSSQIDLLPTVLDLLQIPGPHHSLGKSLCRDSSPSPIFFSSPFEPSLLGTRIEESKLLIQKDQIEFYDLKTDPEERDNLALKNGEKVEKLKKDLLNYSNYLNELYSNSSFCPPIEQMEKKALESPVLHLKFSHSLRITDEKLREIFQACPNLASLSLSHCLLVTDAAISSLFRFCPRIEKLILEGMDDLKGAQWGSAPNLMHFKAIDCPHLGNEEWAKWLMQLPSLRILQLGSIQFSDDGLFGLAQTTGHLSTLTLKQLENITDQGLKPLLAANPHLVILSLEECPSISDASLESFQGRILHHLILTGSPLLTDRSLIHLSNTPLETVFIQNCPQITESGLSFLKGIQDIITDCPFERREC